MSQTMQDFQEGIRLLNAWNANAGDPELLDRASCLFLETRAAFAAADSLSQWALCCLYLQEVADYRKQPLVAKSILDTAFVELQRWRAPRSQAEWLRLASLHLRQGFLSVNLGDYYSAKLGYEAAREILVEQQFDSAFVHTYVYKPLGMVYWHLGDYPQAEYLTRKVLRFYRNQQAVNSLAEGLSDLALIYQSKGEYERAAAAYREGAQLDNIGTPQRALLATNLGGMYIKIGEETQAIPALKQAIDLLERDEQASRAYVPQRMLGLAYMQQGDHQLAETYLMTSLRSARKGNGPQTIAYTPSVAHIFLNLGDLRREQGQLDQALQHYQKALHVLIPRVDSSALAEQPPKNQLYPEPLILEVLTAKGLSLYRRYQVKGDTRDLVLALNCYDLANSMEALLLASYDNEAAKLDLLAQSHERTELALEVAYELHAQPLDEREKMKAFSSKQGAPASFLSEVFQLSESNKSIVLLESVREIEAQMLGKLPDSIEGKLYSLKARWRYYERQYQAERMKWAATDSVQLNRWYMRKIEAEQAYQAFIDQLEGGGHHGYVELKQQSSQVSIDQLQRALLDENQALIEYFLGEEYIFVFVILKESSHFLKLGRPEALEAWVSDMLEGVSASDVANTGRYITSSLSLHQTLLAPIRAQGILLPRRIKVVPDGMLHYLPFEALLTNLPEQTENFKAYPYLLQDHVVSYAYSARLWARLRKLNHLPWRSDMFLGVAPVFRESHRFAPLPRSEDEVSRLRDRWGGRALLYEAANKQAFVEAAPSFNILHIYSHAVANAEIPHMSYIGFFDGGDSSREASLLHLADIYAMKLHADMVVLSACETQTGALRQGEGLMSLARGFTYAGCKSIFATRWQVNSTSSDKLMRRFYRELLRGAPKDEALTAAKLSYLQSEKTGKLMAHPYFWAAYTPIGDMQALEPSRGWGWLMVGTISLLAFLALVSWKWHRLWAWLRRK